MPKKTSSAKALLIADIDEICSYLDEDAKDSAMEWVRYQGSEAKKLIATKCVASADTLNLLSAHLVLIISEFPRGRVA